MTALFEQIVVVGADNVFYEAVIDADTVTGTGFTIVYITNPHPTSYRLRFDEEGTRWVHGKLDGPAANALRTVKALRGDSGETCTCGGLVVMLGAMLGVICGDCGREYP